MVFTGLIQAIGEARFDDDGFTLRVHTSPSDPTFWSNCRKGDSIAVNGVCLTLLEETNGSDTASFFVMEETRKKTNLDASSCQSQAWIHVNLELSLKIGDHLGGHTTSGHVDATCQVAQIEPHTDGSQSVWLDLTPATTSIEDFHQLVVYKGSICVDGVSLTVAELDKEQRWIRVSLIPHTLTHTNLQFKKVGDVVNIEFDQALKLLRQSQTVQRERKTLFELSVWELRIRDEEFMLKAIELGEQGRTTSAPNPWVGCVIVSQFCDIIGRGFHAKAGEGHAEANAVKDAKESGHADLLKNSCVYSTLEPCHPFPGKRTPPCDNLLVECGVKRVVVALADEDKNVSGLGINHLRGHGLEVVIGVCHQQAFQSLCPYLHHRRTGRPLVTAKIASSIDGRVACHDKTSQWITGEEARSQAHSLWRGTVGNAGAVLVGAATANNDRPRLTVRPHNQDESTQHIKQPLRIVLDGRGSVRDTTMPLIATGGNVETKTLFATSPMVDQEALKIWENAGVDVWISPEKAEKAVVDLSELLDELGRRGIMHLLIEGGPNVLGQFLSQGLVDRLVVYVGSCLLGSTGIGWPVNTPLATTISDAKFWKLRHCKVLGNDVCLLYDQEDHS